MRKLMLVLATLLVTISLIITACKSEPATIPPPETAPQETPAPTQEPEPTPESSVLQLSAQELYSAYEANQVAADSKYENNTLIVTGIIDSIGKDILDTPYVVLTSGNQFDVWGVQCMFNPKYESELAKLSKGQKVAIQGRCEGYLLNVLLRDSVIVSVVPTSTTTQVTGTEPTPSTEVQPTQTPAPIETSFTPIVLTGSGSKNTPPFSVTTSEWIIEWSYTSDSPEYAMFGFFVYPRGETVMYVESCLFPEETSGSTYSYAGAGEYYIQIEASNIKNWSISIKPAE